MRIVLAVLTRDRPEMLRACLASLAAMRAPDGCETTLVVIDNNSATETLARNRAAVGAQVGAFPARMVVETRQGIPVARNRAIAEAEAVRADALVFLDDDQTVPPDWLSVLVAAHRETGVDVVKSAVDWRFEPPGRFCDHFAGDFDDPGAPLREVGVASVATNGVLIGARVWRGMGERFDERFPLNGGEDTLFFRKALSGGGVAMLTRETRATEHCPAAKQRAGWLLRRAYRVGINEIVMGLKPRSRADALTRGLLRALYAGVLALIWCWRPRERFRQLMKGAKALGMVVGAIGLDYAEYRTVVGR